MLFYFLISELTFEYFVSTVDGFYRKTMKFLHLTLDLEIFVVRSLFEALKICFFPFDFHFAIAVKIHLHFHTPLLLRVHLILLSLI